MHVKVGFQYVSGDHFVDEADSAIIVISHFEVAGKWVSHEHAVLRNEGPFLQLHLRETDEESPFLDRGNEAIRELRRELTPSEYLEETDEDLLVVPVSRLEWIDMRVLA